MKKIMVRAEDLVREKTEQLEGMIQEKTRLLEQRTKDLNKRVRELNCLYSISDLRERPGISLEEILKGVSELIPLSLPYPEMTCARIIMGYQEFRTKNFRETASKQACDILINGEWGGTIEVYYLKRPGNEEEFFLEQENNLLNAISERLGRIAERVRADDALRRESRNIINILKSMEDWIYKVNDQYDIEYINPAIAKEFGPAGGKKCYEYFRGLNSPCSQCRLGNILEKKTVRRELYFQRNKKTYDVLETPLRNPDGSISQLSILRDLTAVKLAQKTLEERESFYRGVIESIADGAVVAQEGIILFVNKSLMDMFGYTESKEIVGAEAGLLFDSEFVELFQRVFDPKEHDENITTLLKGVCVTKEGKKFWVSTNRSIISFKSRPAILATIRDITEDMVWERSVQEETEYLRRENVKLRSSIKERYKFGKIIGKSLPMQDIYELILKASDSDANVVVIGETGTGKELVSRAIHEMSNYANNLFVPVNCGAIPETLVESEFFGHSKGAFTGAHVDKNGYLFTANGGTLFLDEVGEVGLNMQAKLLRAIETGEYTPVGDTRVRKAHLRVISATNRDLLKMVGEGVMREDFYYRVSVFPILLPPLRDKKEDIPLLIEHFMWLYSKGKAVPVIPGRIMEVLYNYDWPGNVRELQGVIQRYLAVGNFDFLSIPHGKKIKIDKQINETIEKEETDLRSAIKNFEKRFILNTLNQNHWRRGKVAELLGIDPKTLYTKIKNIGLH